MTLELTHLNELRSTVAQWRAAGEVVALVPTMGALHAGHLSLVEAAKTKATKVVASIFVNPAQFGPNEDFNRYPRPLADDLALLRAAEVDAAWLPDVATMYPQGFASSMHINGVSEGLCGAFRPGHFDGVATVVTKLFNQVMPDIALFGEKDYQQLCVIAQLVHDFDMPIAVHGVPTLREADGLAMSSRNRYLSADERKIAASIYATLQQAAEAIRGGANVPETLAFSIKQLLAAGFTKVDYFELRAEKTLASLDNFQSPSRLLTAAWLGTTRLIDNISV
jgi:pantoate--beta-alanine ligase